MQTYKINDRVEIACEWKKTRSAFKHEAVLLINGAEEERVKICYLNRTWEQYTYQSVIHKLLEKSRILNKEEKETIKKYLDGTDGYNGAGCSRDMSGLRSVAMVAALGSVFHADNQKAANDWKARMLRAGLEGSGLIMPDDWDSLSEEEKERRLNGAIEELGNKECKHGHGWKKNKCVYCNPKLQK